LASASPQICWRQSNVQKLQIEPSFQQDMQQISFREVCHSQAAVRI